jgi:hypothetical protein
MSSVTALGHHASRTSDPVRADRASRSMTAPPPRYGISAVDRGIRAAIVPPRYGLDVVDIAPRTSAAAVALGSLHDAAESAADRIANSVVPHGADPASEAPVSDRRADLAPAGPGDRAIDAAAAALQTAGRPLGFETRKSLEPHFGRDLGAIRIHDGVETNVAAAAISARAFALGNHIGFAKGSYAPASSGGLHLLAHEVAHTIQPNAASFIRRTPDATAAEKGLERAKRGLSLLDPKDMCGGVPCFDDRLVDDALEKSQADDAAAEARATAERKRRRDIRAHGTKQSQWQLDWETDPDLIDLKGIGMVAGTRDDGIMTPTGVRVPKYPGDFLEPRAFYERKSSAFLAWQGFVHYAEIVEAGHDAAALNLAVERNGGYPVRDDRLDLYAYTGWSKKAHETRETVQSAVMVADGAAALNSAIQTAGAVREFSTLFETLLTKGETGGGEIIVDGVGFGGVEARVVDGELFVGYSHIIKLETKVSGAGAATHIVLEQAARETAASMGLQSARVGVSHVENPMWAEFLQSRGYAWDMLKSPTGYTGYYSKSFPVAP